MSLRQTMLRYAAPVMGYAVSPPPFEYSREILMLGDKLQKFLPEIGDEIKEAVLLSISGKSGPERIELLQTMRAMATEKLEKFIYNQILIYMNDENGHQFESDRPKDYVTYFTWEELGTPRLCSMVKDLVTTAIKDMWRTKGAELRREIIKMLRLSIENDCRDRAGEHITQVTTNFVVEEYETRFNAWLGALLRNRDHLDRIFLRAGYKYNSKAKDLFLFLSTTSDKRAAIATLDDELLPESIKRRRDKRFDRFSAASARIDRFSVGDAYEHFEWLLNTRPLGSPPPPPTFISIYGVPALRGDYFFTVPVVEFKSAIRSVSDIEYELAVAAIVVREYQEARRQARRQARRLLTAADYAAELVGEEDKASGRPSAAQVRLATDYDADLEEEDKASGRPSAAQVRLATDYDAELEEDDKESDHSFAAQAGPGPGSGIVREYRGESRLSAAPLHASRARSYFSAAAVGASALAWLSTMFYQHGSLEDTFVEEVLFRGIIVMNNKIETETSFAELLDEQLQMEADRGFYSIRRIKTDLCAKLKTPAYRDKLASHLCVLINHYATVDFSGRADLALNADYDAFLDYREEMDPNLKLFYRALHDAVMRVAQAQKYKDAPGRLSKMRPEVFGPCAQKKLRERLDELVRDFTAELAKDAPRAAAPGPGGGRRW